MLKIQVNEGNTVFQCEFDSDHFLEVINFEKCSLYKKEEEGFGDLICQHTYSSPQPLFTIFVDMLLYRTIGFSPDKGDQKSLTTGEDL